MRDFRHFSGLLTALLLVAGGETALAADAAPPVAVDLKALDNLPKPDSGSADQTIHLKPPSATPEAQTAKPKRAKPPVSARIQPEQKPSDELHAAQPDATKPNAGKPGAPAAGPQPLPSPPLPGPPPAGAAQSSPAQPGPAASQQEQASLPPPASEKPAPHIDGRILFAGGDASLPDAAKPDLDKLADRLTADQQLRLELLAFAASTGDASAARRLSLSRAIATRNYLLDRGVDAKQVNLRPLGDRSATDQPADRVDLVTLHP